MKNRATERTDRHGKRIESFCVFRVLPCPSLSIRGQEPSLTLFRVFRVSPWPCFHANCHGFGPPRTMKKVSHGCTRMNTDRVSTKKNPCSSVFIRGKERLSALVRAFRGCIFTRKTASTGVSRRRCRRWPPGAPARSAWGGTFGPQNGRLSGAAAVCFGQVSRFFNPLSWSDPFPTPGEGKVR